MAATLVEARYLFALIGLALGAALISGLSQLSIDNRERAFFPLDDPIIEKTDWLSERMGNSKDSMLLVYRPSDGDALSPFSLSQLRTVSDEATLLPYVTDTHSLFDDNKLVNVPAAGTVAASDEAQIGDEKLAVVAILQGADLFTDEGVERLRDDLRATPTVIGRSVARDFGSAVVTIQAELEEPLEGDGLSRNDRIDELKDKVSQLEALLVEAEPGAQLLLVGSGLFEHASSQVLREDVRQLFPVFAALFLVALYVFYRSIILALGASTFIAIVIGSTGGGAAWLGLPLSTLSVSGLLLVGTLAVADLVHLANGYFADSDALDNPSAVIASLKKHLTPIMATTASTMIGASALFFSPAEPIRVFATVILIGVFLALVFTLLLLPAILVACRRRDLALHQRMVRMVTQCSRTARRHGTATLVFAGFVAVLAAAGLPLMKVDDNLAGWFSTETEFRRGMDLLDKDYLSLRTITLATRVEDQDRDAALGATDALDVGYFRTLHDETSQATVGRWLDIASVQDARRERLANAARQTSLHPDPAMLPAELDPPSSRTLADSGLLTRLEPGVSDWVISYFDAEDATTFELLRQVKSIEDRLEGSPVHKERETRIQGVPYAFARVSSNNFQSIALGSLLSITLVSLAMVVVFRSFSLAAISLIPNCLPLILVYGTWGWLTGTLNMAAVGVFATAFGIIVDDTIHFISAFRREMRETADLSDIDGCIDRAIHQSGSAILVTTILLATGFLLLSMSDFTLTAQKAGMVGATILIALFLDLLVLPVVLKRIYGSKKPEKTDPERAEFA